jgi:hypothetical protein
MAKSMLTASVALPTSTSGRPRGSTAGGVPTATLRLLLLLLPLSDTLLLRYTSSGTGVAVPPAACSTGSSVLWSDASMKFRPAIGRRAAMSLGEAPGVPSSRPTLTAAVWSSA